MPDFETVRENMVDQNKAWAAEEQQLIFNFIKRKQWTPISTGTGIKYQVYQKGDTTQMLIQQGDVVFLNYEVFTLDSDTAVYSSENEPESFLVGMDHVESGLHEAMTYLRKGDRAKIILPSHRAFGLIGDLDQIPPQSPVVYDVEVVKVEKP